jgi:hypothetical protein
MWQAAPDPRQVLAELEAVPSAAHAHAHAQGASLPAALDPWFARALHRAPEARFATAGEAARLFQELVNAQPQAPIAEARVQSSSAQSSGVAAAVAAPLLFQELPRPSPTASASAATGEAPHSSRPPGFTAPRAATTEHVAGLPPQPPVALLAAVGVGLIATLGLAGFGLVRLFSSGEKTPSPAAAESAAAPQPKVTPSPPAATPAAATSAQGQPKTQAHFACAPVTCEWVVCDGENVKKGQLELELTPGKHSCSASRYGYRTAVTEFVVEAGKTTRVPFELLPAKAGVSAAAAPTPKAPTRTPAKAVAKPKKASTTSGAKSTPTKSPIIATSKATTSAAKPAASSKSTPKTR